MSKADGSSQLIVHDGTCHATYAYSIGLSVDLPEAERLIGTSPDSSLFEHQRRTAHSFSGATSPLVVTQRSNPIAVNSFETDGTIETVLYDFGAVAVTYMIPFKGPLSKAIGLATTLYDPAGLLTDSRKRVADLLAIIDESVTSPTDSPMVEDYVVHEIKSMGQDQRDLNDMLQANRLTFAQVLRAEPGPLSEQEIDAALSCTNSYTRNDLAVLDWNASLVFGRDSADVRAVIEYANVSLLQLRYLDVRLDTALSESFRSVTRTGKWRVPLPDGGGGESLRRIAGLQMDGALLFEGVHNTLKLLGDQYLARVYRAASQRLHLGEWESTIQRKLQTLESIYDKMADRQTNRRMEVLEWIIIILIAVSIGIQFVPSLVP
jgi:hypothetical protein